MPPKRSWAERGLIATAAVAALTSCSPKQQLLEVTDVRRQGDNVVIDMLYRGRHQDWVAHGHSYMRFKAELRACTGHGDGPLEWSEPTRAPASSGMPGAAVTAVYPCSIVNHGMWRNGWRNACVHLLGLRMHAEIEAVTTMGALDEAAELCRRPAA